MSRITLRTAVVALTLAARSSRTNNREVVELLMGIGGGLSGTIEGVLDPEESDGGVEAPLTSMRRLMYGFTGFSGGLE